MKNGGKEGKRDKKKSKNEESNMMRRGKLMEKMGRGQSVEM